MAKKILIVDDEPEMLEMLELRMKKNGYAVVTAITGIDKIVRKHDKPAK